MVIQIQNQIKISENNQNIFTVLFTYYNLPLLNNNFNYFDVTKIKFYLYYHHE